MSERVELVCAGCGEPGRIYREVDVPGWEAVDVYRGESGLVEEATGERDVDDGGWTLATFNGYGCSECAHRAYKLADMVTDMVTDPEYDCPRCNARGCRRCAYTGRETAPPPPHPGQQRLEDAA